MSKVTPGDGTLVAPIPKDMVGKVVDSSDGPLAAPQSEGFHDMGDGWKLYVESWRPMEIAPRAVFVHHHGNSMSSSGCAEGRRLGHALNAAGIELWSFDVHGCGYSIDKHGKRVRRGITEGTNVAMQHFLTLCEKLFVPRAKELGVPLIACGHSFGGSVLIMGTQRLLEICNREAVRFPLALLIDAACNSEYCFFNCCCGGCGKCCRAYGPACCNCRVMNGPVKLGWAWVPPEAEEITNAAGVPLPHPGPGDCHLCDAFYLACGGPASGGFPDIALARQSFGVHIKEPNKPKIVFMLAEKSMKKGVHAMWQAVASEGGKAGEYPSDAPEWMELDGVEQHQFLSDIHWKKTLNEVIMPKVVSALGNDRSSDSQNPPVVLAAPAQEGMAGS